MITENTEKNNAIDNAQGHLNSIVELHKAWMALNAGEVESVVIDGDEYTDADRITDRVWESVLSAEVRDGWRNVGAKSNGAEEFRILLSTGGPACQIIGDLNDGSPENVRIQHRDWGTHWTNLATSNEENLALAWFCGCFCFEE